METFDRYELFVSPKGSDSAAGTFAEPYATIAKAREAVREKIAQGLDADIHVYIRGGIYMLAGPMEFGVEDSGNEKYKIVWSAWHGEKVTFSGGRPVTGWQKEPDGIWTAYVPEVAEGRRYFRQLFVNARRAVRARTPNIGAESPWLGNGSVCYDVTSISSYSQEMPAVERGYNSDGEELAQFNLGLFCDEVSKAPLYYKRYNGSLTDRTNLSYVLANAKSVGIQRVKMILDGGFWSEE